MARRVGSASVLKMISCGCGIAIDNPLAIDLHITGQIYESRGETEAQSDPCHRRYRRGSLPPARFHDAPQTLFGFLRTGPAAARADVFTATAARMSSFNAFSSILSPSWKSMARLVLPS